MILQQCFSLFNNTHKPIILFSTPTFADNALTEKLTKVIHLCQEDKLQEALIALYQPVFHPYKMPALNYSLNKTIAYERLIFGLSRVLQTDSRAILEHNKVKHLHLIGEYSNLVNKHNVIAPLNGRLLIVPKASMRVLQDNLPYCQGVILEALKHETSNTN